MNENIHSQLNKDAQQEESINYAAIIDAVLSHWFWYALSIIVCLALGYLYIKRSTPIYSIQSTIMIKDEMRGGEV